MINLSRGLKHSLIILEHLRDNEELSKRADIHIGTFTNCREVGLTFMLGSAYSESGELLQCDSFTWCVYEHRNSDTIINNGKAGYISFNGDLPYAGNDKYTYLAEYSYNEHYEAAEGLAKMIIEYIDKNGKPLKEKKDVKQI